MRIIIAGPPKAGNVWLKCILGHIYDLRPLTNRETPQRPQFQLFKEWVASGGFPDGTVGTGRGTGCRRHSIGIYRKDC